jgi:hypothetical protein
MKKILLALLCCASITAYCQQQEKFHDWQWKPTDASHARFISTIKNTDSGWLCIDYFAGTKKPQMVGLYKDSSCKIRHGYFRHYYSNGKMEMMGRAIDNKNEGLWLYFHRNGMMSDSTVYQANKPIGTSMSWYSNGFILDSTDYDAGVQVKWFDNGQPAEAGHIAKGKFHGKWQFFNKEGGLASSEVYDNGKMLSRTLYDKLGKEQGDTSEVNRDASFRGGDAGWKKYLLRHLYFPDDYRIVNGDIVTILLTAVIDEEGNVTEPAVSIPFDPRFDEIALKLLKNSPKWQPATAHNRAIKTVISQPISFKQ